MSNAKVAGLVPNSRFTVLFNLISISLIIYTLQVTVIMNYPFLSSALVLVTSNGCD